MSKKINEGMAGDSIDVESGGVVEVKSGGRINFRTGAALKINDVDATPSVAALITAKNVQGVGSGYKIARGVHLQVAASDTVATGLATVVAAFVSHVQSPTVKQTYVSTTIGDQDEAPPAGSILIEVWKNPGTPSDDLTENLSYNWIAVGT